MQLCAYVYMACAATANILFLINKLRLWLYMFTAICLYTAYNTRTMRECTNCKIKQRYGSIFIRLWRICQYTCILVV